MKSWNVEVEPSAVFEYNNDNLRIAHLLRQNAKLRSEAHNVGSAPMPVSPIQPPLPYPLPETHAYYPPLQRQQVNVEGNGAGDLGPLSLLFER